MNDHLGRMWNMEINNFKKSVSENLKKIKNSSLSQRIKYLAVAGIIGSSSVAAYNFAQNKSLPITPVNQSYNNFMFETLGDIDSTQTSQKEVDSSKIDSSINLNILNLSTPMDSSIQKSEDVNKNSYKLKSNPIIRADILENSQTLIEGTNYLNYTSPGIKIPENGNSYAVKIGNKYLTDKDNDGIIEIPEELINKKARFVLLDKNNQPLASFPTVIKESETYRKNEQREKPYLQIAIAPTNIQKQNLEDLSKQANYTSQTIKNLEQIIDTSSIQEPVRQISLKSSNDDALNYILNSFSIKPAYQIAKETNQTTRQIYDSVGNYVKSGGKIDTSKYKTNKDGNLRSNSRILNQLVYSNNEGEKLDFDSCAYEYVRKKGFSIQETTIIMSRQTENYFNIGKMNVNSAQIFQAVKRYEERIQTSSNENAVVSR